MCRLDVKSHLLERENDLASHVLTEVNRSQVEISAGVVGLGGRLAIAAPLEQEELGLGSSLHDEAATAGSRDDALERRPRAAGERCAIRVGDVADDPPHAFGSAIRP